MAKDTPSGFITIRTNADKILQLTEDGKKLLIDPLAEKSILQLLEYQEKVNNAVDQVKTFLQEAGEAILPNFKGVESGNLRIMCREYGSKYKFSGGVKADSAFVVTKEVSSIDSKAVDDYYNATQELPVGIEANKDRNKSLSITVKGKKDEQIEA